MHWLHYLQIIVDLHRHCWIEPPLLLGEEVDVSLGRNSPSYGSSPRLDGLTYHIFGMEPEEEQS